MTIYEFMTILDMQTDPSAKVMDTLYVPVKIGDNLLELHLCPLNKIVYFFKSILFIFLNL